MSGHNVLLLGKVGFGKTHALKTVIGLLENCKNVEVVGLREYPRFFSRISFPSSLKDKTFSIPNSASYSCRISSTGMQFLSFLASLIAAEITTTKAQ